MKKKLVLSMIIAIILAVIFTACKTEVKQEPTPTLEVVTDEGKKSCPQSQCWWT